MTRTPHHSKKEEIRRPRFAAHPGSRGRLFIFWYVQIGRYAPFVHGALEGVRKINCCTRLRHDGIPFSGKRFGNHKNHHAGAAPAQIGMKTEAAKFPVFCYNSLERGTLQSTEGGVVRSSPVAKAV